MSNTLKMNMAITSPTTDDTQPDAKIVTPAPTVEVPALEVVPPEKPAAGSTEVREFIAMLRRERKARALARRLKRTGWAFAAVAVVVFVVARSSGSSPPRAEAELAPGETSLFLEAADEAWPAEPMPAPSLAAPAPSTSAITRYLEASIPLDAGANRLETTVSCEENFTQQRWRAAVESCTGVFDQAPDAALALRIAHAHWSRGHAASASRWARKALGLGTRDADAFVLIGHAELQAGRHGKAVAAYRRYLEWSPRGWHAKRLRAALRELKPKASDRPSTARRVL
jgi:Tetratricopeptide repeat